MLDYGAKAPRFPFARLSGPVAKARLLETRHLAPALGPALIFCVHENPTGRPPLQPCSFPGQTAIYMDVFMYSFGRLFGLIINGILVVDLPPGRPPGHANSRP